MSMANSRAASGTGRNSVLPTIAGCERIAVAFGKANAQASSRLRMSCVRSPACAALRWRWFCLSKPNPVTVGVRTEVELAAARRAHRLRDPVVARRFAADQVVDHVRALLRAQRRRLRLHLALGQRVADRLVAHALERVERRRARGFGIVVARGAHAIVDRLAGMLARSARPSRPAPRPSLEGCRSTAPSMASAGVCAGCGCAHAPSSRAATSTCEVLTIILLLSPAIDWRYYRRAPAS